MDLSSSRALRVLGSGAAAGLPVRDCRCARCAVAVRDGVRRAPAAVDIGGRRLDLATRPGAVDTAAGRVLWAPHGVPAGADTGAPYAVVLLGGGDVSVASVGHGLAGLRAAGLVTSDTAVLAVGVSHDAPPAGELRRRLAAWGVAVAADGDVVPLPAAPADPLPRRTLVLGGARSGKSAEAERLLAAEPQVAYVATAYTSDTDREWSERLAAHRARRPRHWSTVETLDLVGVLDAADRPLLVDCLSLWLAGVMAEPDEVGKRVDALVAAWREAPAPVVAVSSEVGSGVVPTAASGRLFRDLLGDLNARIAAESEQTLLVVAGRAVVLDG